MNPRARPGASDPLHRPRPLPLFSEASMRHKVTALLVLFFATLAASVPAYAK